MNVIPFGPISGKASWVPSHPDASLLEPVTLSASSDIRAIEKEWLAFQARATGTIYQTYQWCRAWQDTVAGERRVEPFIVTGRNREGRLLFLLPFGIRTVRGWRIVEWYSGRQCNYGYGLHDRAFLPHAREWFASQGWRILSLAGPVDAIDLADMPEQWGGHPHPLGSWFSFGGPNISYLMRLPSDYQALYCAKRSGETRRGNRKRDAKLGKEGPLSFGLPSTRREAHERVDEMFEHQAARLAESGIHDVFPQPARSFIHRLIDLPDRLQPFLLPFHLTVGGRMESMMLGGHYGGGYWALISSLSPSGHRRHSPGEAALRKTIEACCTRGLSFFDFSSGRTAYKLHWADETVILHHAMRAITARGYAWALCRAAAVSAKRVVKRSPTLWACAGWVRRRLGRSLRPPLSSRMAD
jgi:CelD/BcsL family acetyltransferase involved in cellulose biosynthesis